MAAFVAHPVSVKGKVNKLANTSTDFGRETVENLPIWGIKTNKVMRLARQGAELGLLTAIEGGRQQMRDLERGLQKTPLGPVLREQGHQVDLSVRGERRERAA